MRNQLTHQKQSRWESKAFLNTHERITLLDEAWEEDEDNVAAFSEVVVLIVLMAYNDPKAGTHDSKEHEDCQPCSPVEGQHKGVPTNCL